MFNLTQFLLAFIASSGFWGLITAIYNHKAMKNDLTQQEFEKSRRIELAIARELLDNRLNAQIELGFCSTEQLKRIIDFYTIYKELGGNSYIEELMERVEALPKE